MNTQDKAYFCPACGSPAVDASDIVGGDASCNTCKWGGPSTDLIVHNFEHDMGKADEVIRAFATELKSLMARQLATPMALLLYKWGFLITNPVKPEEITQYMVAIAQASVKAVFETRHKIEKERIRNGN